MSEPLTQGDAFAGIGRALDALSKALGEGAHTAVVDDLLVKLGLKSEPPAPEPDAPAEGE